MIKFFVHLLFPVPICIEILLVGLFALWCTRKQKAGKIFITVGVILLILFSSYPFPRFMLGSLEKQYLAMDCKDIMSNHPDIRYIVVLGGGIAYENRLPITSQFYSSSLVRVIEGIRLYYKIPNVKLILSGGGRFDPITSAELMVKLSKEIGVDEENIIIENTSLNTNEEAELIKHIVNRDAFLLVTSASHMPRAMALFKQHGMKPIAAPTDHRIKKTRLLNYNSLFPNGGNLGNTETAFYEYLGFIKERLAGHI